MKSNRKIAVFVLYLLFFVMNQPCIIKIRSKCINLSVAMNELVVVGLFCLIWGLGEREREKKDGVKSLGSVKGSARIGTLVFSVGKESSLWHQGRFQIFQLNCF